MEHLIHTQTLLTQTLDSAKKHGTLPPVAIKALQGMLDILTRKIEKLQKL